MMPLPKRRKSDEMESSKPPWDDRRTDETRLIEKRLAEQYPTTEAYRFNSASIRIRIVDERFEGMPTIEREDMVWPLLDTLPKKSKADVSLLLLLAPSELKGINRHTLVNQEFEYPRPSRF